MRILTRVLAAVAAVVVLLILVSFLFPQHVEMKRDIVVAAPASAIYPLVVEPRRFNEWSPWADRDPDAVYEYSGPESGVGAAMSWSGNRDVGVGSQTVTEVEVDRRVVTALDFGPQGQATATFTLEPEGDGTRVTWGFETDLGFNPMARWFGLFMEGMLEGDYEQGLANLKRVAEAAPAAPEAADPTPAPPAVPEPEPAADPTPGGEAGEGGGDEAVPTPGDEAAPAPGDESGSEK